MTLRESHMDAVGEHMMPVGERMTLQENVRHCGRAYDAVGERMTLQENV